MNNQEIERNTNKVVDSYNKVKATGERVGEDVKDTATQVWDQTKGVYEDVKSAASSAYETGKKELRENIGDYSSVISDVEAYVTKNPVKSILIGLGLVVVGTRLMKN